MIRLPKSIGILVPLVLGNVLAGNLWEQPLEKEQRDRLKAGEVVFLEPEPAYLLATAILIKAPETLVWEIMIDHERLPQYMKDVRSSEIKEAGDSWKIVEHRIKVHTLLPTFQHVFREDYGSDYLIEFQRLSGGIKELNGWWKIIPDQELGGVILMYSVFMDVGWYIPKSWIRKGIDKRVPAFLNAFRDEVYKEQIASEEEVPGL